MIVLIEAPCALCSAFGATDTFDTLTVCADAEACCARRMHDDELCQWCCERPRLGRMNICAECDDEGWIMLPDGSWIEEQMVPRLGFAFTEWGATTPGI